MHCICELNKKKLLSYLEKLKVSVVIDMMKAVESWPLLKLMHTKSSLTWTAQTLSQTTFEISSRFWFRIGKRRTSVKISIWAGLFSCLACRNECRRHQQKCALSLRWPNVKETTEQRDATLLLLSVEAEVLFATDF